MKRFSMLLAAVVIVGAAGTSRAAPGDRARTLVQQSQQRIDKAEAQIRDIVRNIASSGSPQATAELNQQLKSWEAERANAQFALYQAREELRQLAAREAQLKADIAAFIRATEQFAGEARRLREEGETHNQDAAAQREAVRQFNARAAQQRSQAEADRLNFWRDVVNARRDRLQNRQNALEQRRAELQRWQSQLQERARQLEKS